MKITILALGSRGDTQPYVALALGLTAAGHQVCLCAGSDFEEFVTGYGLAYASAGINFHEFVNQSMQDTLQTGSNTFKALGQILRRGMQQADALQQGVDAACQGADLIIGSLVGGL